MRILRIPQSTSVLASQAAGLMLAIACLSAAPLQPSGEPAGAAEVAALRPSFVVIMTDDLSLNLLTYMSEVQRMQRRGVRLSNFIFSNALCCPSRASFLTGRYPQNHGVLDNRPPAGGYDTFHDSGQERDTLAVDLASAGYRTGHIGKYLNGYGDHLERVPAGWRLWRGQGEGESRYGYDWSMSLNGVPHRFGDRRRDFGADVMRRMGVRFIRDAASAGRPFYLELSPTAPHHPYPVADRHKSLYPEVRVPRTPNFNTRAKPQPRWQRGIPLAGPRRIQKFDAVFRRQVRSVQAVNDMIRATYRAIRDAGVSGSTYVVFTSDNGHHTGQHGLGIGKMLAYEHDARGPFVITGPGLPPGTAVRGLTQNVDFRPTVLDLAGLPIPQSVDGLSFAPLLHGRTPGDWRRAALIQHWGQHPLSSDPDGQPAKPTRQPTNGALRTASYKYVMYADGTRELYLLSRLPGAGADFRADPHELRNLAPQLSATARAALDAVTLAYVRCRGAERCRAVANSVPDNPFQ